MRGGFLTTKLTRKTTVHQNIYIYTHTLMYNKWEGEFKTQVLKIWRNWKTTLFLFWISYFQKQGKHRFF